ncbi:hypothetical protein G7054_g2294 [Neopestalotiopsis clavispora]|nr:hypothetical protein G7054_g2294 [Neopestalotiopsis clavispora]
MSENTDNTLSQCCRHGQVQHDLAHIGSWAKDSTCRCETHDISSLRQDICDVLKPPHAPITKETQRPKYATKALEYDHGLVRWQLESVKEGPWTVTKVASSQAKDKGE